MFHLCETGCDGHVPIHRFCDTLHLQSHACGKPWLYKIIQCPGISVCTSVITISFDSHRVIPKFMANIVAALIPVGGEHWLAQLTRVCNHEIPVQSPNRG